MKKQIAELKSKLGLVKREITALKDRERQEYEIRRNASPSFRAYEAAKAAHLRSLQQQEGQLRKVSGRLKIIERIRRDIERAFTFGTVVPTRRLPWRVLPPGESSVSTLYLQTRTFSEWAMLNLNQRPPPCKRQNHMFWMFTVVSEYLQIPAFLFYGRSAGSLLFRCVVVKSSSAPDLHCPGQSYPAAFRPLLALMYK